MTFRITLKTVSRGSNPPDTFDTEARPDIVEMPPPDGRTVIRAIVGGRVVRRVLESVHRVEEMDEAGGWQRVEIDDLRRPSGLVDKIEKQSGVNPPPRKREPEARTEPANDAGSDPAEAPPAGKPAKKKTAKKKKRAKKTAKKKAARRR